MASLKDVAMPGSQNKKQASTQPEASQPLSELAASPDQDIKIDPRALEARQRFMERNAGRTSITYRQKLAVSDYGDQTRGHHITWINGYPGNVESFLARGYSPVLKDTNIKAGNQSQNYMSNMGSWVSAFVGRDDGTGKPLYAYLMKIPEPWYQEDRAEEQRRIDDGEKEIYGENFERNLNLKGMRLRKDLTRFEQNVAINEPPRPQPSIVAR